MLILLPILLVIWLVPVIMIGISDRTRGNEKIAWILLVIFVSWFAWVFYLLLAPLKTDDASPKQ
ncbi:hypothetical protein [Saliniradius amylolyticus]